MDKNYGVLDGFQPTDYMAGSVTEIVYEERLKDGQWGSLTPKKEGQSKDGLDTMGCVTWSALNCLEIQEKLITGKEPNYSDRFTAKASDTTKDGNWAFKVADTIRHKGLVDELSWPWSEDIKTWDAFYSPIPKEIFKEGLEYLEEFDVQYEWVGVLSPFGKSTFPVTHKNLKKHLKQSPLQIGIPICPDYHGGGVVAGCNKTRSQHAITLVGYNDEERYWEVFDHYFPFKKKLSYDYPILWSLKYVLTKKSNKNMEYIEKNQDKLVQNAETGEFGIIKGDKVLVASDDRAGLLALTTLIRNGYGSGIPKSLWDDLPKDNF